MCNRNSRVRQLRFESLEDRSLLSITPLAGDYSGNNSVGAEDRAIFSSTFNSTTDLRADGNSDGVINAADYTVYRDNFGATRPATPFLNLVVDGLGDSIEAAPGAIVFRNSDFSKQVLAGVQPEAGLPSYIPDYQAAANVFDPEATSDFSTGSVRIDMSMVSTHTVRLTFPNNIRLWTTTSWAGMVNVGGGRFQIPSGVELTPSGVHLDFQIEGIGSSVSFGGNALSASANPISGGATQFDFVSYTVVDTAIGVDGNRDTTIDFANNHDRQLLFWLNNDQEGQHPSNTQVEYENVSITSPDNSNNLIGQRRDLEDLAPLRLNFDPLLVTNTFNVSGPGTPGVNQLRSTYSLSLKNPAGASLRLFKSTSTAVDVIRHVNNESTAITQATDLTFRTAIGPSFASGHNLASVQAGLNAFLFEANGGVYGAPFSASPILVLTTSVTYGNGRTTKFDQEVALELRDIKQLYTRWDINYGINGGVSGVDLRKNPNFMDFATPVTPTHSSQVTNKVYWDSDEKIVFVHGWNNLDNVGADDKSATAETMLKRLYWQGYRGEFVAFNWPTFADREVELNYFFDLIETPEALALSYNPSEFQAFRSAKALKEILAGYRGEFPSLKPLHLFAHSMGNVVASEALRLWAADITTEDALVTNYVAMEPAISAGAWGDNGRDSVANPLFPNRSIPDLYRFWSHGRNAFADLSLGIFPYLVSTAFSAEKMINLYNEEDYALNWWDWNNFGKDIYVQSAVWPFDYDFTEGLGENTNTDTFSRIDQLPTPDVVTNLVLTTPTGTPGPNAYEILAFFSRPASKPVGVKSVGIFDTNIDIATYGLLFGNDILANHSFQFAHDSAETRPFYLDLKAETGFLSTQPVPGTVKPTAFESIALRSLLEESFLHRFAQVPVVHKNEYVAQNITVLKQRLDNQAVLALLQRDFDAETYSSLDYPLQDDNTEETNDSELFLSSLDVAFLDFSAEF